LDKLLWRATHKTEFNKESDFLETILTAYGIEDIDAFLNVSKKHTHDPFLFRDMKQGIELLHSKLGGKIYIKRDTDVDGLTSSAYMQGFINDISPETEVVSSTCYEKEHGIFLSDIEPFENIDLIIVPDAGSTSVKDCKAITEKYNIPILILDHHEINDDVRKYATLINCMDGAYPNNMLSGVGVVHKFCLACSQQYGIKEEVCNKYLDLVALGMIADSMDMRSLETRYYALEGLKEENRKNKLIKELALASEEELKLGHTLTNYGWIIAPKLNGTIRYGKEDEQQDLFRAICGEKENREYQPRRPRGAGKDSPKPPIEIHSLQKTMARVCANVKARQDKDVREFMKKLDEKIQEENLNVNSVLIVDGTDILTKKTVSGLVANKLAEKYQRPVVILKSRDKDTYGGSGRGYEKGVVGDFNSFLSESDMFTCAGHPNAFGIKLAKKELANAIEFCNKKLKLDDLVTVHEVDYEVKARNLTPKAVMKVAEAYQIWGRGVEEPTFAITEIEIPAKDIQVFGDSGGFIKFTHNNVSYIKKYCPKGDYEAMTLRDRNTLGNSKILHMTIIGNFIINEYEGNNYPQVKIKYFESEEYVPTSKNKVTIDDDFLF
jgi:single-stranded-DNA-specific exonuclease